VSRAVEGAIVLHEDKKYYPDAEEVYPDAETLVQDEDTQALTEPIIAPIKTRVFSVLESTPPATTVRARAPTLARPRPPPRMGCDDVCAAHMPCAARVPPSAPLLPLPYVSPPAVSAACAAFVCVLCSLSPHPRARALQYSTEFLVALMDSPALIRSVAVVGHLHHGKTGFVDLLVSQTHEKRWAPEKEVRYTDTRKDEQDRGVSIKCTPVSLVLPVRGHRGRAWVCVFVAVLLLPGWRAFAVGCLMPTAPAFRRVVGRCNAGAWCCCWRLWAWAEHQRQELPCEHFGHTWPPQLQRRGDGVAARVRRCGAGRGRRGGRHDERACWLPSPCAFPWPAPCVQPTCHVRPTLPLARFLHTPLPWAPPPTPSSSPSRPWPSRPPRLALPQTERVITQAVREKLDITLVINKVDRLVLELKLPPTDAYFKLVHTIEEVNGLISAAATGEARPRCHRWGGDGFCA
jgi:hypothetical protein